MCARLKSNQGSARPKSADQPTEINTTAGRVIILELLVRASCSAVNERRTKMAIHTTAGVLPKYCRESRQRAGGNQFLQLRSIFNYSSAHQLYCTHWRTPKQKVVRAQRYCWWVVFVFVFFCRQACRLLLTKVAILCTISGCSPTACWHLSD